MAAVAAFYMGPDDLAAKPRRGGQATAARPPQAAAEPLAVIGCEVAVGAATDTTAILRVLLELDAPTRRIGDERIVYRPEGRRELARHARPGITSTNLCDQAIDRLRRASEKVVLHARALTRA